MVVALSAAACSPRVDRPERALAQFLGHVQRGRAGAAWKALTADSQARLRAEAAALAKASGRPPTDKVDEILFQNVRLRASTEPESIVVVGPLGARVRLRVSVPHGRSAELWMAKEDGQWKVDLVESLVTRAPQAVRGQTPKSDRGDNEGEDLGEPSSRPPSGDPTEPVQPKDQPAEADAGDRADAPTSSPSPTGGRPDTKTPNASKP